jgi:hypothetical protein
VIVITANFCLTNVCLFEERVIDSTEVLQIVPFSFFMITRKISDEFHGML